MDFSLLITTVISSSVIATLLSSLINLYIKKQDFKNEYYKLLIKKRMDAYEWIENQLALLKTSVIDEHDGKPYHQVFSFGESYFLKYTESTIYTNSNNLWLNQKTNNKLDELIHILNRISFEFDTAKDSDLIKAGKQYYWDIAKVRDELENLTRRDLLKLYNFKHIKKKNSKKKGVQLIEIKKRREQSN